MISYFCVNIVNNSFEQISQQILFVSNHRGSSLEAKCFCSINSNRFSARIFQHVPMTDSSTIFHMDCCFPGIRAANTPRAFHFRHLRHFLSSHLLSWGSHNIPDAFIGNQRECNSCLNATDSDFVRTTAPQDLSKTCGSEQVETL